MIVSPPKTDEPIEMPFGVDSGGPKEAYTRWGPDSPREGEILIGKMTVLVLPPMVFLSSMGLKH